MKTSELLDARREGRLVTLRRGHFAGCPALVIGHGWEPDPAAPLTCRPSPDAFRIGLAVRLPATGLWAPFSALLTDVVDLETWKATTAALRRQEAEREAVVEDTVRILKAALRRRALTGRVTADEGRVLLRLNASQAFDLAHVLTTHEGEA